MYFITDHLKNASIIARFKQCGTDASGWEKYYVDPIGTIEWVEYYPYSDDRAPSIFRNKANTTDLHQLFLDCLTSKRQEDWRGVALHLAYTKVSLSELTVWIAEVDELVNDDAKVEFRRTFNPLDNRNIIGRSVEEIAASYAEHLRLKDLIRSQLE